MSAASSSYSLMYQIVQIAHERILYPNLFSFHIFIDFDQTL